MKMELEKKGVKKNKNKNNKNNSKNKCLHHSDGEDKLEDYLLLLKQ
jgi:hypothetical protein